MSSNTNEGAMPKRGKGYAPSCAKYVDLKWPSLKYLSLACYSAWILLMTTGSGATAHVDVSSVANPGELLYKYSGIALSACLFLAGFFSGKVQPIVSRKAFCFTMALLASASTFFACGGLDGRVEGLAYAVASICTGVGTSFVCLRVGSLFSTLNGVNCFFTVCASGLISNLLYFMCISLPTALSVALLALLPLASVALTFLWQEGEERAGIESEAISISSLPKGYFARLMLMILVLTVSIGVVKGLGLLLQPAQDAASLSSLVVFASFVFLGGIALSAAIALALSAVFELGRLYYPLVIILCFGILLSPMFGGGFNMHQAFVVNTFYNVFTMVIWTLLSEIANRTSLSATRVFGFGRGASALGTTLGWFGASAAVSHVGDMTAFLSTFFVVMAIMVVAVTTLVFNERTVGMALEKTIRQKELVAASIGGKVREDKAIEESEPQAARYATWDGACGEIALQFKLTNRESEVMALLGRGRTVSYVSEELFVSPNTAKGYVKNVYAKCGVHSRQELIDLIESRLSA